MIIGPLGKSAFHLAFSLFLSNGLLNTLIYAYQSRFVERTMSRTGTSSASFKTTSSNSNTLRSVGFQDTLSVRQIDFETAEAIARAGWEAIQIERRQSGRFEEHRVQAEFL